MILRKTNQKLWAQIYSCRCHSTAALDPAYQPSKVEQRHRSSVQQPPKQSSDSKPAKEIFTMVFPPPNVTGYIHLGHCLTATVQDVIARHRRSQGQDVIWVPGTDHAGIATQMVVEKVLQKEKGLTRHQLGRAKFLDEVWRWKEQRSSKTKEDLLRLGTTLNWDREYFTMNESHSRAVREAFIRLFERDLIYRSEALVNWSCFLESAISDIEVDNIEIPSPQGVSVPGYSKKIIFGQIYDIAYRTDSGEEIVVATTRPETLLGDAAIAVHPSDTRYSSLLSSQTHFQHPFRDELIPLVADDTVDPNFGTGAVKVTPAHDPKDFLIGKKHGLKRIQVINVKGQILPNFAGFADLPRFHAREKILMELEQRELLKGLRPHSMSLPVCSRSKDIIEFMLRPQWFVRSETLSNKALEAVQQGKIKLTPQSFNQEWERWLSNCHDWCISRQLWWGHRIPAYSCRNLDSGEVKWRAAHDASQLNLTGNWEVEQDEDVLDTWFSSALLPFSVFGWPDSDPQPFFPLKLMETGHDILFFWVARMAMLSLELTGRVPFHEVLLHGIICDAQGRKMSKSLGNVISPEHVVQGISLEALQNEARETQKLGVLSKEELEKTLKGQKKMFPQGIPECGTDSLRFTLCSHNIQSHFINFDITECNTNKLFFNKIWQATRYTIGFCEKMGLDSLQQKSLDIKHLSRFDSWILSRLSSTQKTVNEALETYNFHLATAAIKTFFYQNLCDVYLETTKRNQKPDSPEGAINCQVLSVCLRSGLDLIEPFTPHLVAELRQFVPNLEFNAPIDINLNLENEVEEVLAICVAVRQQKSQHSVTKRHNPILAFKSNSQQGKELLEAYAEDIKALTFSSEVLIDPLEDSLPKSSSVIKSTAGALCSFSVYSDKSVESTSAQKLNQTKLAKLEAELQSLQKKISSEGYRQSANERIKTKHSERIAAIQTEIKAIKSI